MVWSLEIHHLDIKSAGDATIIIASDLAVFPVTRRAVLIDGGKTSAGVILHNYIANILNLAQIDVIAVTHYDKDHVQGITALLGQGGTTIYDNAIIYDLGSPPSATRKGANYRKYIGAIGNKPGVRRATVHVNSFNIVQFDRNTNEATIPRGQVNGSLEPHWLVGKEIMWGNGGDGVGMNPPFASNPPPSLPYPQFASLNPPTITCIAANKYVLQTGGVNVRFVSNVDIYNGPKRMKDSKIADYENKCINCKSLAFLVQFNNFKYYVGGDIESIQEDGCYNPRSIAVSFQPGIRAYLNQGNTMAGRVLAMKASHHGSDASTSRDFVDQVRPAAAFISTGVGNQYKHPGQACVNVLDGYESIPINAIVNSKNRHPVPPPPAPYSPVSHYLTGYQTQDQNTGQWLSYGGDASETAGDPTNNVPGHIRLEVSDAQSQLLVVGQTYRGINAAVTSINTATGGAAVAADIANAGATYGTAVEVALVVGAPNTAAPLALRAVARVGNDAYGVGVISAALAAIGAAAATAAAAGVDEGSRVAQIGNGVAAAIGEAVTGGSAGAISAAALAAVPAASADAANAAGVAAATMFGVGTPADAGFAAAAAMGAVYGGASVIQAVAIAMALATFPNATAMAGATAAAILAVDANARSQAALVGAVAGATDFGGIPQEVENAVVAALTAAGYANANAAGTNANAAATIPNNVLFNVHFATATIPNANVPHS